MTEISQSHRVALAGPKHCGKSTLGKLLAARWGVDFVDADRVLSPDRPIRELYRELGEELFRRREAETVRALGKLPGPRVVALGGGAVGNRFITRDDLKALGALVFLDLDDDICIRRVLAGGVPPFLCCAGDPASELRQLNAARREACRKIADAVFPIRPPERAAEIVADELAAFLETR